MEKICEKCGSKLKDTAFFCSKCGTEYKTISTKQNIVDNLECNRCGATFKNGTKFCIHCGEKLGSNSLPKVPSYIKKGFNNFTASINSMTEEKGSVEIHLKELFSEIFSKHSLEEREELFASGTTKTTPSESDMISDWPKPWLYTRIFLMFAIVLIGLLFMIEQFGNTNAVPGIMFIGALIVPFPLVIFFWEVNVPRNISIFEVVSTFFIGGVLSLISTLFIYEIVGIVQLDYLGAILVGIVEEVGKISIVGIYIKRKNSNYILNGLLFGACVGAGFAVFETAGYAFTSLLSSYQISDMTHTLFLRAALSIGGHTTWTAIAGVGLIVAKENSLLSKQHYYNIKFLKFLLFVIVLHAIWDMPVTFGSSYYLVQLILTSIAIIAVLVLLSSGLNQVSRIVECSCKKEFIGELEVEK